jgi:hypothetical protein
MLWIAAALGVVGGGAWFLANRFEPDQHGVGVPSAAAATAIALKALAVVFGSTAVVLVAIDVWL